MAKMENRKKRKEISARTRHQQKSLEQCLEEAPWRLDNQVYSLKQSVLAPSLWWILPIPLAQQRHKLPKISPDH
eukprot:2153461-Amphidinium_carterae.1